jgi:carbonyl reductase 1
MMTPQRVAVVTGGNKGIGFYIAAQLATSGQFSDVIIGCRDPHRGLKAQDELRSMVVGGNNDAISSTAAAANIRYVPLTIGDTSSHSDFCRRMEEEFGGKVDVLVNNAGFAYKGSDPTPFQQQTEKTLDINYFGLVDFTEKMIPLLQRGSDPRVVNVASMAGRLNQVSPQLQKQFTDPNLTIPKLNALMLQFQHDVQDGTHQQQGWSNTNYGMSKLGVIAATKVWARQYNDNDNGSIRFMACCPGYCSTDMSSHRGTRSPQDGAKNAVMLATMNDPSLPPNGCFFQNYKVSTW